MKPRTHQLRYLSIALFALWGRAGAEELPPFLVNPALLGKPAAVRPVPREQPRQAPAASTPVRPLPAASDRPSVSRPAPALVADPQVLRPGATVITADKVLGRQDVDAQAEGSAVLVRDASRVEADRMQYFELTDEVEATGNVRVLRGKDEMRGPHARVKVQEQAGFFDSPEYAISRPGRPPDPGRAPLLPGQSPPLREQPLTGHGSADKLYFEGENQFRFTNATWTSCKPDRPDWYLKAREIELDYDTEVGEATGGTLWFKGVPVGYLPWADFPLGESRKSGLLTPTFGTSNKVGADLAIPYYFNLAPNYDATLTTRFMGRRGMQFRTEARYLTPGAKGLSYVEYMPEDKIEGRSRYVGTIRDLRSYGNGWSSNVDFNGVSDPRYFIDLSTRLALTSRVHLARQGQVSYAGGGWWSATGMIQSFQTLDDPRTGAKVATPYKRLPQLTLTANRADLWGGSTFQLASEYVSFSHPTQDKGRRLTFYPQLSLPMQTSAFFVTPKIGVHATRYDLDRTTSTGDESLTRTLPIFSVDSGVTFERETRWGGKDFVQTLEPRIYYLYVPYRDQSSIPNFDSGFYDFNYAQIFAENVYTGGDRISNANQITTAVQSRLIDPETGAERFRALLGQRYYLVDQRVTLNKDTPARTGKQADLLAALGLNVAPRTTLDTAWQYNPRDNWTERFNFGFRFQPGHARTLGVSWRYRKNYSTDPNNPNGFRDIDLTGQWPLWGNWYGVARYNRNLRDHRLTQGIAGLEYNAGCWVFRSVIQHLTTSATDSTRAFFFQLEFNGAGSLGSSPLNVLRRSVPGYGKINDGSNPFNSDDDF
ncbi:LPS-assembly protein LptD [Zoogloea sp.]|uniref:LPS-assembly protein LptD n=1 Tax=Zoogloea sp. TaxID=49181 RepID=UPI002639E526|nr:LPS-assembly protein LptD [Zoogloea sp.]MDD3352118.1 LPS-assembly protein LptD [Zoogloea sp.]